MVDEANVLLRLDVLLPDLGLYRRARREPVGTGAGDLGGHSPGVARHPQAWELPQELCLEVGSEERCTDESDDPHRVSWPPRQSWRARSSYNPVVAPARRTA